MKRTTSEANLFKSTNNSGAERTSQIQIGPPEKSKPVVKTKPDWSEPSTPAMMEARLFALLASESEQALGKPDITLGHINAMAWPVPLEITDKIAGLIESSSDRSRFALIGRQAYLSLNRAHPLRRLPGLISGLKSTCPKTRKTDDQCVNAFLKQSAQDGSYDKTLLTPLSVGSRLGAALAALGFLDDHVEIRHLKASESEALTRIKAEHACFKEDQFESALLAIIKTFQIKEAKNSKVGRHIRIQPSHLDAMRQMNLLNTAGYQRLLVQVCMRDYLCWEQAPLLEQHLPALTLAELALIASCGNGHVRENLVQRLKGLPASDRPAAIKELLSLLTIALGNDEFAHLKKEYTWGRVLDTAAMCLAQIHDRWASDLADTVGLFYAKVVEYAGADTHNGKGQRARREKISADNLFTDTGFRSSFMSNSRHIFWKSASVVSTPLDRPEAEGFICRDLCEWLKTTADREAAKRLLARLPAYFVQLLAVETPDRQLQ